ncbi:MAG: AAA family ATPase [Terriglobia bacterium]|jgi:hypothetical protein
MAVDGHLLPNDVAMFARIGVDEALLRAAQVRRVTDVEARNLPGTAFSGDLSGILFPYLSPVNGDVWSYAVRRDNPEIDANGKPKRKYLFPRGHNRLYFPPGISELLADVTVPMLIPEAVKSSLAFTGLAARSGRKWLAVAPFGCWGWRGKTGIETGPGGEREEIKGPLPDCGLINFIRRKVLVAFDANVACNPKVRQARQALAETLVEWGAQVFFVEFPQAEGVNGPDDWIGLAGDKGMLALLDVAKLAPPKVAVPGVLACDVVPEKVRWLWPGHIPLGKVTLFEGDPDEGKSTVALDLSARTSSGASMPDGSAPEVGASGVVIVSLEDGKGDTIRPRLEAAGADLSKIRIVDTITGPDGVERTVTIPAHLRDIEAAIDDVNAKLLVIDPLAATLGGDTDSHKDQDVRRALAPLAALAEKKGVAVICIRHLNKGNSPNPKYRGGGSIGITGAARACFLFADDPDNDGARVMAPVKGNLWRVKPPAIQYKIVESASCQPVIAWEGGSTHTARSLLAQPETQEETNACADAKTFLIELLKNGGQDSKSIMRQAHQAGISDRTLKRAKAMLGVKSRKVGMGEGQHWEWELPKSANAQSKSANNEDLAPFEQPTETKSDNSSTSAKGANGEELAPFGRDADNLRESTGTVPNLPFADDAELL